MRKTLKFSAVIGLLMFLASCAITEIGVPYLEYKMPIESAHSERTSKAIYVSEAEDLRTTLGDLFTIGSIRVPDTLIAALQNSPEYYPVNLYDPITAYFTDAVKFSLEEAGYMITDDITSNVSIQIELLKFHIDNDKFKRISDIEVNVIDNTSDIIIYSRTFYSEADSPGQLLDSPKTYSKRMAEELLYAFLNALLTDDDFKKAITT